ncbi:MAG TPA: TolC family protein [Anaerolineae bacterium]|jgi:outer membrane protein
MKQWIRMACWLTLAVCPLIGWAQEQAAPPTLTLEECLTFAQAHNRTLRIAQQAVQQAGGRIVEARGAGQPQINLTSAGRVASEEKVLPLAVDIGAAGQLIVTNVPLVPDRSAYAGFGVSKVIDISGVIKTTVAVASLGQQVAQRHVQSTRNDLLLQVKAAYYEVLRAKALVVVAQTAITNAQTRRKLAQALVDAGINSKVDLFRADAAIAATQQSLIAANNALEVDKAGLNNLLGRDVNTPFDVQFPNEAIAPVLPYDTYLQEALAQRPEIMTAQTNLRITEQQEKLAQQGMKPSLVLNASAEYDVAHRVEGDAVSAVGAAIVFPLSDGGMTKGRVVQARADSESAKVATDDTIARVSLEVKSAYVTLQNAGEKLTTARKELEQATESLRLSRIRYEQGIANQVELSDAELQLTQAQTNVVNAQFAQLVAQAALDRAMGRFGK